MKKFCAGMILAGMMAAALAITGCPSPAGDQATYSISLDQTGTHAFSEALVGYEPQAAKTVTVTNTGNQATGALTVGKSGANPDSFTVSKAGLNSIAPGGNDSFTVVPVTALAAGTYTATITVSGGNSISAGFNLSFTVTAPAPAYSIGLSQTGTYAFPGAAPGYEAPNALTITVNNTGTQATGALDIAKSGADAGSFTVSPDSLNSIAAGGNDSFTVVPVTALPAGTYAATITVSGGNSITATFNVSFAVTVPVEYGIGLSQTGTYTFPPAVPGYGAQNAITVTVNNRGTQATGALTIAKSGAAPDSFTVSTNGLNSIAAGGNDSFTVVPVTALSTGTHTATITVNGDNSITASFNVSFTVDTTLYTVTFDADGGTPATSSVQTHTGGTVSLPGQPAKSGGYTFGGWYTAKNGVGAIFNETTPVTEDLTVYARWLSVNANLSSLSADSGWLNPTFSPYNTAYTMTFPNTTTSLTVSAAVMDTGKASLEFLSENPLNLNPGANTVRVRVTAEDGTTTQVYTITVTRTPLSANANLGSLSVSEGPLNQAFSANTTAYTVLVPNTTGSIIVTAAVADTGKATVNQSPQNPVTLSSNSTVITLTVTAENGTTTKDYTVTVNKTTATNAVNVTISIADKQIDLTKNTEDNLSKDLGNFLRLTAPEGYTTYTWYVDMGSNYQTISERVIEIPAYAHDYGTHSVLLQYANEDGIPYGCEVLFKVVR